MQVIMNVNICGFASESSLISQLVEAGADCIIVSILMCCAMLMTALLAMG